jgi:hypothetical protein
VRHAPEMKFCVSEVIRAQADCTVQIDGKVLPVALRRNDLIYLCGLCGNIVLVVRRGRAVYKVGHEEDTARLHRTTWEKIK